MKIRKPNRIIYNEGWGAFETLTALLGAYKANKEEEPTIWEFDPEIAEQLNGGHPDTTPRHFRLDIENCRYLEKYGSSPDSEDRLINLTKMIEKTIGAPALRPITSYPDDKKLRPVEEILLSLTKTMKKMKREVKDLKNLAGDIEDCQNPELLGKRDALEHILNGGKCLSSIDVMKYLRSLMISRERDRLYYIHKHPTVQKMWQCQNLHTLSAIKTVIWSLNDYNPFGTIECHGKATYAE